MRIKLFSETRVCCFTPISLKEFIESWERKESIVVTINKKTKTGYNLANFIFFEIYED